MLSTFTSYSLVANNLTRALATTAAEPVTARETQYYKDHVGDIKTVDDFMKDTRVYNYVMKAYGLEDMSYAKAMIRKVLEGGIDDSQKSLSKSATYSRFRTLATAFNFVRSGAATTITTAVRPIRSTTTRSRLSRRARASRAKARVSRCISNARRRRSRTFTISSATPPY